MKRQTRADLAMTAAVLFLGASLVFSGTSLLRLHWQTIESAQPLDLAELLGVAGAGAGIALLCWWLLAMACACVAAVAHARGAAKVAAFAAACSPAFMRRVVGAVLGLNLLAAPLLAAAAAPGVDPLWRADTVVSSAGPSTPAPNPAGPTTTADPLPPVLAQPLEPQWVPRAPATAPDLLVRPSTRPAPGSAGAKNTTGGTPPASPSTKEPDSSSLEVVVKNGDSLWTIVAAALGPFSTDVEVAQAWPRWYSANRDTIGADPNYILPGQVLHAPSS
ncbi:MAG: hypothetical protein ABI563_17750 [Specibacter sp.]